MASGSPLFPNYQVFVSHAGEDKATIAIPLRDMLSKRGITAFVDERDIPPGGAAVHEMTTAMADAVVAVIILSPEFVAKEWPMKELMFFLKRRERAPMNHGPAPVIIPVFYRLSIEDLYYEPRLDRKDADGKSLYRATRFYERMDAGEPEANTDTIKAALRALHGIMGVINTFEATNNVSSAPSRLLLLHKICEIVSIATGTGQGPRKGDFAEDVDGAIRDSLLLVRSRCRDSLGFGVQPCDSLFDHSKLRGRVLDLGHFEPSLEVRSRVTLHHVDNFRTNKRVEEGFDEFTRRLKFDQKANISLAGFKSSVSSHYTYETTMHTDYYFSRTVSVVQRAHVRVTEPTIPNLQTLVVPSVATFLATSTPQQIFSAYGTHVTTGLVVGGELEFWSSSKKTKFDSKDEFSRGVSACFKKLVQGSASLSAEEAKLSSRIESKEGLIVRGGTFTAGPNGQKEWAASTANNAQEIAYLPNGAVPIWLLIPTEEQADRVRSWYEKVFGSTIIILRRFSSPPLETVPEYPHPGAHIYVPDGWKVVSGGATVQYFGLGQLLTTCHPLVVNGRAVGWEAKSKDHIENDPGKIRAHAMAIWDPFDSYDVVVRKATSEVGQHPTVSVKLPKGYARVGGGAATLEREPGNLLVANYPILEDEETWFASSKDHLKACSSRIEAYIIGIRWRDGGAPKTRVKSLTFGPLQHPFGTVRATEGYEIIGGGAQVSKGGKGNMLVSLIPSADGESFSAHAKDHLRPDSQRIIVYAIEVEGAVLVNSISEVQGIDPTR